MRSAYNSPIFRQNNIEEENAIMDKLTSGKIAPKTGAYNIVSSKGKVVGSVRVKKGNRMPPTRYANSHFEIDG